MKDQFRVRLYTGGERSYLLLLSAFCISMLVVRMIYTASFTYRFMAINLFLAWIPYGLSIWITRIPKGKYGLIKYTFLFLWLLFFPNAAYMVTDIFHLPEFPTVPMWFDLIMLLSFAWCGLLLGFNSLQKIHHRFFSGRNMTANIVFVFSLFFLGGIGIYLGRYQRWNSWDVLTDPGLLYDQFRLLLSDTIATLNMFSLALLFAVFLTLVYMKLFYFKSNINSTN